MPTCVHVCVNVCVFCIRGVTSKNQVWWIHTSMCAESEFKFQFKCGVAFSPAVVHPLNRM